MCWKSVSKTEHVRAGDRTAQPGRTCDGILLRVELAPPYVCFRKMQRRKYKIEMPPEIDLKICLECKTRSLKTVIHSVKSSVQRQSPG